MFKKLFFAVSSCFVIIAQHELAILLPKLDSLQHRYSMIEKKTAAPVENIGLGAEISSFKFKPAGEPRSEEKISKLADKHASEIIKSLVQDTNFDFLKEVSPDEQQQAEQEAKLKLDEIKAISQSKLTNYAKEITDLDQKIEESVKKFDVIAQKLVYYSKLITPSKRSYEEIVQDYVANESQKILDIDEYKKISNNLNSIRKILNQDINKVTLTNIDQILDEEIKVKKLILEQMNKAVGELGSKSDIALQGMVTAVMSQGQIRASELRDYYRSTLLKNFNQEANELAKNIKNYITNLNDSAVIEKNKDIIVSYLKDYALSDYTSRNEFMYKKLFDGIKEIDFLPEFKKDIGSLLKQYAEIKKIRDESIKPLNKLFYRYEHNPASDEYNKAKIAYNEGKIDKSKALDNVKIWYNALKISQSDIKEKMNKAFEVFTKTLNEQQNLINQVPDIVRVWRDKIYYKFLEVIGKYDSDKISEEYNNLLESKPEEKPIKQQEPTKPATKQEERLAQQASSLLAKAQKEPENKSNPEAPELNTSTGIWPD